MRPTAAALVHLLTTHCIKFKISLTRKLKNLILSSHFRPNTTFKQNSYVLESDNLQDILRFTALLSVMAIKLAY